ncbi:sodium/solute symporter [Streptomyces physcomitrii]|uniref:Cation acetate symporter n=1 Tax=Streptomyces physcomitrii TaxID=2724184 RepID=A0ABX1H161_9ACTN|nr:cation acetate symporter [Streptomyces physcomitrii]NKI42107.1 cation acetate symporter [Streptomyces physcomitrii]
MTELLLAAGLTSVPGGADDRAMVPAAFMVFVAVSLLLCVLAGPGDDTTADFYTGNRSLTPMQNALALTGDYLSAAALLGVSGLVAVAGYDGISLAVSSCLAVGVFLLLAGPLRNAGGYTLGDILALRSPGPSSRIAAATATLAVCLPFLVLQLAGAGSATALLLGLTSQGAAQACTVFAGVLMICYTVLGGMRGTSLVQIAKVAVVFTTMVLLALLVLRHHDFDPGALLTAAERGSGLHDRYFEPGHATGDSAVGRLDFLSLQLSVVLGGACMPHILMRINSAADGATARRATRYAVAVMAVFFLCVVIAGLGAAGLVGGRRIRAVDSSGQTALLLLAGELGHETSGTAGSVLYTAVACSVFVTVLAVVAGIALSAAAALAHDLHAHAVRGGRISERREVRSARWAAGGVGGLGVLLAATAQGRNLESLTYLALALAASTVLPACVYGLFWSRYNRTGLLWTVYGGVLCTTALYVCSLSFSGTPASLLPGHDFHLIGLQSTAVLSVPAGFLLGWAGSVAGRRARPGEGSGADPRWRERVLAGAREE